MNGYQIIFKLKFKSPSLKQQQAGIFSSQPIGQSFIRYLMILESHINRLQGIQILERYFQFNCDFDQLVSYFSYKKRTKQQLFEFIKQKIKEIALQIQVQLFRAKKISCLKLFDHSSDTLFSKLTDIKNYLPQKLFGCFVFQQKCRNERLQKSTTGTKLQIYNHILKYAQQNDLLKFVFIEDQKKVKNRGLLQSAKKIYEDHQLQLLSTFYQVYQGNYQAISQKLIALGYKQQKFLGEALQRNFNNLELIGLYKCLMKSVKSTGARGPSWQKFIHDQQDNVRMLQKWDKKLRSTLIKIAIRDKAKAHIIRIICRKIGKRFEDKPLIDVQPRPAMKKQERFCDTPQMQKHRQSLFSILNVKIWFNHINLQS